MIQTLFSFLFCWEHTTTITLWFKARLLCISEFVLKQTDETRNQSKMLTLANIPRWLQTNAVTHVCVYLFVNVLTAADACLLIDGIPVFCVIKISSLTGLRRSPYDFQSHSTECMFHSLCCIRVWLVWLMGCGSTGF